MRRKISQREATRLRKRAEEAENKLRQMTNRYSQDYPGTFIWRIAGQADTTKAVFENTRRLGHAIVVKLVDDKLEFYAVKP
jgi:hypothetical protein